MTNAITVGTKVKDSRTGQYGVVKHVGSQDNMGKYPYGFSLGCENPDAKPGVPEGLNESNFLVDFNDGEAEIYFTYSEIGEQVEIVE